MRNMKRTLSLVLAMIMLLGMVMIPTGAASTFADADLIENAEAVQITSGIGLFAGTSDGNFGPLAPVTRAQMATIIVKMLRGSNFNADAFKGVDKFPDTASFEGGWAEGYINACVQLGVVAGYGDGTFKPGRELTTAEAMTMIINALGIDPGPGDWPVNYMAKAETLKLYGDMVTKPATDAVLTRDQLAVIVWEGLQYSPAGKSGYKIPGSDLVFADVTDAIMANGNRFEGITEAVGTDSLASKVYEVKVSTGWITANQASGAECTVLSLADGSEENYNVETNLDMLGHYVTIYYKEQYKNEEEPGEVYTVVDESTVVIVKEPIDTAKEYKAAFGKSHNVAQGCRVFEDNYAISDSSTVSGYTTGSAAPEGTYIIADGVIVAYIKPIAVYASYITSISKVDGEESVGINKVMGAISNTEGDDLVVEYDGMAVGDLVSFVKVARDSEEIYVLSPLVKVSGTITKTSVTERDGSDYNTVTLAGTEYQAFEPVDIGVSRNYVGTKLETRLSKISYGQNYTLYITESGHYVGFEESGGTASVEEAVYILTGNVIREKNTYGKYTFYHEARGVDMTGAEVKIIIGKAEDTDGNGFFASDVDTDRLGVMTGDVAEGFYTVSDSKDSEERKEGIQKLTPYANAYQIGEPNYAIRASSGYTDYIGDVNTEVGAKDNSKNWSMTNTKYLLVKYDPANQSTPLETKLEVGRITNPINLRDEPVNMLVCRDLKVPTMRNDILVMVKVMDMSVDTGDNTWVYVTDEQLETPFATASGKGYVVYDAVQGKETEYVLDPDCVGDFTDSGFYQCKTNEEGIITKIDPFTASSTLVFTDKQPQVVTNMGFLGVTRVRVRAQRLGLDMANQYNNSRSDSAGVFDLRTEEEIKASGIPAFTSRQEMEAALVSDPGVVIVFDMFMKDREEEGKNEGDCKSLYVKKVIGGTVGLNSVVYAYETPVVGTNDVLVVRSNAASMGESFSIPCEFVRDPEGPGFYRYCVDENGMVGLVPVNADYFAGVTELKGTVAWHNAISSMSENEDGTYTVKTKNGCSCGATCTFSGENDVGSIVVDENVMILDMDGDPFEVAELKALVRNKKNEVFVDYYCDAAYGARVNFVKIQKVIEKETMSSGTCNGVHTTGWSAVSGNITAAGNYYLSEDYSGTIGINTSGAVTLCLNGYDIIGGLTVSGATVDLINCNYEDPTTNNSITGGDYAVVIESGAALTLNDAISCEGVKVSGSFTMVGGEIAGNTVAGDGGGVYVTGGTVTITGGTISRNKAANGGGVYVTSGTVTMTGGTISTNEATGYGGGVQLQNGTLTMSGDALITGNTANNSGGGVGVGDLGSTVNSTTSITLSGAAAITKNTAKSGGGGVFQRNGTTTISGGEISGNKVTNGRGGGMYCNAGTMTISGVTSSGNTASHEGKGVCTNSGKITIRSGTFAESVEVRSAKAGTITITGGTFTGAVMDNATKKITITGGTFSSDPQAYVNLTTHTVTEDNGKFTVTAK